MSKDTRSKKELIEEVDMLRAIIGTTLETTELFVEQDSACKRMTGSYLPKSTARAFITANYQSLQLSQFCKTMDELGSALHKAYENTKEQNEKA